MKKKEDSIPCAALFAIRNIVAFEWPWRISKLLGPETLKHEVIENIIIINPKDLSYSA